MVRDRVDERGSQGFRVAGIEQLSVRDRRAGREHGHVHRRVFLDREERLGDVSVAEPRRLQPRRRSVQGNDLHQRRAEVRGTLSDDAVVRRSERHVERRAVAAKSALQPLHGVDARLSPGDRG